MRTERPTRPTEAQLREALARRPDGVRMADDLALIVAATRRTRQHAPIIRLLLVAAAVMLAVLTLLGAILVASRPFDHHGSELVAVDVDYAIWITAADGSGRHRLTAGSDPEWQASWSPDGAHVAYWADDPLPAGDTCGVTCEYAPRRLMVAAVPPAGPVVPSQVTTVSNLSGWRISWAPDSRRLVVGDVVDGSRVLVVVDTASHDRTRIGPADLDGFDATWSPDGRHIAFARGHVDVTQRGLYVMDPDGTNERRLSSIPSRGAGFDNPEWSPASDRLAVAVEAGGADPFQKDIWVISLDGAPEIDVSNDPADEGSAAWSPDGRRLSWVRALASVSPGLQVVVANSDGTGSTLLAPVVGGSTARWSPDGSDVLAVEPGAGTGGADRIVTIDVRTGVAAELVDGHAVGEGTWQALDR